MTIICDIKFDLRVCKSHYIEVIPHQEWVLWLEVGVFISYFFMNLTRPICRSDSIFFCKYIYICFYRSVLYLSIYLFLKAKEKVVQNNKEMKIQVGITLGNHRKIFC